MLLTLVNMGDVAHTFILPLTNFNTSSFYVIYFFFIFFRSKLKSLGSECETLRGENMKVLEKLKVNYFFLYIGIFFIVCNEAPLLQENLNMVRNKN